MLVCKILRALPIVNKIFFDANIIIDIYDTSRPQAKDSYLALKYCLEQMINVVTTCDIVTNVYYITSKYSSPIKALDALADVEKIFSIIPFDNEVLKTAIKLMQSDNDYFDLEDCIQYVLAEKNNCEIIITHDKNFTSKNVKTLSPGEFLKYYKTTHDLDLY